jgi:hypothetical protein
MAKENYAYSNNHFRCMGGQGLNQSFTKHNIKFRFKVCGILSINPMEMEYRIGHSNIYTTPTTNHNKKVRWNTIHMMELMKINNGRSCILKQINY